MSDKIMDLMLQGLDKQGVLSKVRAQIKASVFKIIDQATGKKNNASTFFWENDKAVNLHKSNELLLLLEIVKEFLQFFNFDYTLAVLLSESNHKEFTKREQLIQKLNIGKNDVEITQPILQHIVQKFNPKNPKQPAAQEIKQQQQQQKSSSQPVKIPQQQTQQTKNQKIAPQPSPFQDIDIEEDIEIDALPPNKKSNNNLLLTSSEEFLASQSQGLDITVDSNEIYEYDHVEDIRKK